MFQITDNYDQVFPKSECLAQQKQDKEIEVLWLNQFLQSNVIAFVQQKQCLDSLEELRYYKKLD